MILLAVVSVMGVVLYFSYTSTKIKFNDSNAVGNTAGNLNNGGLFCEYKDKIYFSNPYDLNRLYIMNSDCTNAKRLNEDRATYINVFGDYIYYTRNNYNADNKESVFKGLLFGLYRTDLKGEKPKALYNHQSSMVSLSGNYIFYQQYDSESALSLYKIKIDGSEHIQISDDDLNPSSVFNGKVYTSNIGKDHNIYSIDAQTNAINTYCKANSYMIDMEGTYLYYIDMDNDYALVRLNINNNKVETLTEGRCIAFNRYGSKIFYQLEGNGESGLYRMNVDGSQKETILIGNITNLQCTSQYTFFHYFDDKETLYRIPTTGAITGVEQITISEKKK